MPTNSIGLARPTQPLGGVAELTGTPSTTRPKVVTVMIEPNELDGVEVVIVDDDDYGMTHHAGLRDFKRLGVPGTSVS
jgi:hypothetical protein